MKKTLLIGNYGMKNTGYDALLATSIWGAKNCFNAMSLAIKSPRPIDVWRSCEDYSKENVETLVFGHSRIKQYTTAFNSHQILFSGDTILKNEQAINLNLDLMLLSGRHNHLALGVGIGPFENLGAERSCKKFLRSCQFVGVRDLQSLDIAKDIAPDANVELTFDLAPLILNINGFKLKDMPRRGIAICLSANELSAGKAYLSALVNTLNIVHCFTGEPIVFINFNGHDNSGNHELQKKVAGMLNAATRFCIHDYDANPFRVLQRMASYKAIISMHLYGKIFGFLTNTPVISIDQHKVNNTWSDQIGMPPQLCFHANKLDSVELTNQLCKGLEGFFEKNIMTIEHAFHAAMKNWRKSYERQPTKNIGRYSSI